MPPAFTKGHSTKPAHIKTAVIVKRLAGSSKAKIARELEIAPNTVSRILSEAEMSEAVKEGRSRVVALIPKAIDAVEAGLDKKDPRTGLGILQGVGVLKSGGIVTVNIADWAPLELARLRDLATISCH